MILVERLAAQLCGTNCFSSLYMKAFVCDNRLSLIRMFRPWLQSQARRLRFSRYSMLFQNRRQGLRTLATVPLLLLRVIPTHRRKILTVAASIIAPQNAWSFSE